MTIDHDTAESISHLIEAGRLTEAESILRALETEFPDHLFVLRQLGVVLAQLGMLDEARKRFIRAVDLAPDDADLLADLGNVNGLIGFNEEAENCFTEALRLKPSLTSPALHLGQIWIAMGRFEEAADIIKSAFEREPSSAQLLAELAKASAKLKRLGVVEKLSEKMLELEPANADYLFTIAEQLSLVGSLDRALKFYEKVCSLENGVIRGWIGLGLCRLRLCSYNEAAVAFQRASEIDPLDIYLHEHVAGVFFMQRKWTEAESSLRYVLKHRPDDRDVLLNLGGVLLSQGRADEALEICDALLKNEPDLEFALGNRGAALSALGKQIEARDQYAECYQKYHRPSAKYAEGMLRLLLGDLAEGFTCCEARLDVVATAGELLPPGIRRPHSTAIQAKLASDLEGRCVCVITEQGVGDSLQFFRYLPMVVQRASRTILCTPPALEALFKRAAVGCEISTDFDQPDCDVYVALMSLPHLFGTILETIPADVPYLTPEQSKIDIWAKRLGSSRKLRIGLAWTGNPSHLNDYNRSVVLETLLPILKVSGVDFFSLQQVLRDGDQAVIAHTRVQHFGQELKDFDDTAALCSLMDLVIAVDTSVAHLAGALGKPVWLLLTWVADWRWLEHRSDSPWYPSATLFRQPRVGDWGAVVNSLLPRLKRLISTHRPGVIKRWFK